MPTLAQKLSFFQSISAIRDPAAAIVYMIQHDTISEDVVDELYNMCTQQISIGLNSDTVHKQLDALHIAK